MKQTLMIMRVRTGPIRLILVMIHMMKMVVIRNLNIGIIREKSREFRVCMFIFPKASIYRHWYRVTKMILK